MDEKFANLPFQPADILLPRSRDLGNWSVVACDQYTSQPEYWARVAQRVGQEPSTLHMILPESSLEGPDVDQDIAEINLNMAKYLRHDVFQEYPNSLIYVERTLASGAVRRGLVGAVDLEDYDYEPGSTTAIRATEGTVMSRIPPRVKVRKNAPIELPHTMLLVDDPELEVIAPLAEETGGMEKLYDFTLMEGGGRVRGYRLTRRQMDRVADTLRRLGEGSPMLFAVGDGNHSLATAKECYEQQKRYVSPQKAKTLPARYTLVELVALQDESLEFEPIHRVVFGVDPGQLLRDFRSAVAAGNLSGGRSGEHAIHYVSTQGEDFVRVPDPAAHLPVGTLQIFLDDWLARRPQARVDYIHGSHVARSLATSRQDTVAFLLPPMEKRELFPTVIYDGALPRKTFSMGEAHDKRYYLEARKIR